jgi:hypothetical protein
MNHKAETEKRYFEELRRKKKCLLKNWGKPLKNTIITANNSFEIWLTYFVDMNSEQYRHNNIRCTDGTICTEIIRRSTSKVTDV